MPVDQAVQLKSFKDSRKLGELVASLGLEDKVIGTKGHCDQRIITNEALSQQRLATKAEFLQGLVDGLLAKGNWKKVVDLVFRKSSVSELYEDDKLQLLQRIKDVVKPTDLKIDRDRDIEGIETIGLLIQNGGAQVVYELALRPDFDYRVSEALICRVQKALGEETYKTGLKTIATRIQKEHPAEALRFFEAIADYQSIGELYKTLMTDFSLDNLSLLVKIERESWRFQSRVVAKGIKEIVEKSLHEEGRDQHKELGKYLFSLILDRSITLSQDDQAELRRLTILSLDRYDFNPERTISTCRGEKKEPYKDLELDWAKVHWQKEPIFAYALFLAHNYEGQEVIDCAEKAFREMHEQSKHYSPNQDKINISLDHLAVLLSRFTPEEIELRKAVALEIKYTLDGKKNLDERTTATLETARTELRSLSLKYKAEGEMETSYKLWFEGNGHDGDAEIQDVREQLIAETMTNIESDEKNGSGWYSFKFNWLNKNDQTGYKLICDRLIDNRPLLVYTIAKERKDEATMARARDLLFSRYSAQRIFGVFSDYDGKVTDQAGYDQAVDLLTKSFGASKDDFMLLLGRELKQE